jgi:hypothetical protein
MARLAPNQIREDIKNTLGFHGKFQHSSFQRRKFPASTFFSIPPFRFAIPTGSRKYGTRRTAHLPSRQAAREDNAAAAFRESARGL